MEIKLSDTCYYKSFLQNEKNLSVIFRFQECKGKRKASEGRIGGGICFAPSPDTRVSYPPRSPEKHEKIMHVLQAKDTAKIDIN